MRTRIILVERLVLMTCEMRHNMRSQNFKSVFNGHCSDKIGVTSSGVTSSSLTKAVTASQPQMAEQDVLEDNWTKFHVESDATPYHDAWTTPSIPFHHAVVIISFSCKKRLLAAE
jgi:hypothetical protein